MRPAQQPTGSRRRHRALRIPHPGIAQPPAATTRAAHSGVPSQQLTATRIAHYSGQTHALSAQGRTPMLWTIFVILLVLWMLGLVTSYTMGGFIHILLVIAVVILIINLIQGRRTL